ncbi:hypothetical protein [Ralstonia pseudosolanacearum]|uniref:Uncharacterized protein n=1 Tax=Ralstonia solanacearum TaxID=305 RepID=A0A0S4WEV2_RALSL|nr:hypothetical protein [Ralstonia pseudosolanacearum]MDO3556453.1 hypothetical protein [Ralstonia pseudosolanacearum]MDO3576192.1 hypothetical protein [Ralstonia pseudosolanacearum]MDO3585570.1 hypothetical protein [Ralstonia pseudosolanacearum]CUV45256.1 exported protein of unknown function [Ralstonia solanacearum]
MRNLTFRVVCALALAVASGTTMAASAIAVLGKDFAFPSKIQGLPEKLSDFKDLRINTFTTSDGVKLSYWEAGEGGAPDLRAGLVSQRRAVHQRDVSAASALPRVCTRRP